MNLRLGHSLRLSQSKNHGNIERMALTLGFADENQKWHLELNFSQFSDQIKGKSTFDEEISLSSSLEMMLLMPQLGVRLMPGSSRIYRDHVRGIKDRLYLYGFLGLGWLSFAHDYSYLFPAQATAIEYHAISHQVLGSLKLRFACLLTQRLDLILDLEYMRSMGLLTQSKVEQFTLYNQDLSYRSEDLGVEKMLGDGLSSVSVLLGVRYVGSSR